MSAETLRRAAALIRERAEKSERGPWVWDLAYRERHYSVGHDDTVLAYPVADRIDSRHTATHIASWHPTVALAVADWLDAIAPRFPTRLRDFEEHLLDREQAAALTVARAYLVEGDA